MLTLSEKMRASPLAGDGSIRALRDAHRTRKRFRPVPVTILLAAPGCRRNLDCGETCTGLQRSRKPACAAPIGGPSAFPEQRRRGISTVIDGLRGFFSLRRHADRRANATQASSKGMR